MNLTICGVARDATWQSAAAALFGASIALAAGAGDPSLIAIRLLTSSTSNAHEGNGASELSQLKLL